MLQNLIQIGKVNKNACLEATNCVFRGRYGTELSLANTPKEKMYFSLYNLYGRDKNDIY